MQRICSCLPWDLCVNYVGAPGTVTLSVIHYGAGIFWCSKKDYHIHRVLVVEHTEITQRFTASHVYFVVIWAPGIVEISFKGTICEQKFGTAMGNPVSQLLANLFMENLEQTAQQTCPTSSNICWDCIHQFLL